MSKIKREFKSVLATALTIMLVLSMMMGVFTLSASADGSNQFPVVLNKPVMVYRDYWNGLGYVTNTLSTISIRMDDSNAGCGLSNISNISYVYTDEEGGISKEDWTTWYIADRFNVLLVNVSTISDSYGISHSDYVYRGNNMNFNRKQYQDYLKGLGRSSLYLNVNYSNGQTQRIDIGVVDEKLVTSTHSTAWETAGSILVRLAHSKLIENEDFFELDNAIAGVQSVNMDTTNKYYVDIDSEDEVKLPMNEMSDTVELVQTRVGNNVIYNSYGSVDFGGSSVAALSAGKADVGITFYMPNGAYASCDDPWELVRYMWKNGYFYPVGELDGQSINMNGFYYEYYMNWSSSIYQEKFGDLVDRGYLYTDYYQGLSDDVDIDLLNKYARLVIFTCFGAYTGYEFGMDFNEEIFDRFMKSSGYGNNGMWSYYSPSPFVLSFDGANDSSVKFLNNLQNYINHNSSTPLAMYLNGNSYYNGRESGSPGNNETYVSGDQRFFRIAYSYKNSSGNSQLNSSYVLSVNNMSNLINGTFNSDSDANLLALIFTPVDFNAKKGLMLPDERAYQAYEKLIEIAEQSGLEIKLDQSFMPRRDYENCEKIGFKDYIASCGVTIKNEQEQRLAGKDEYFFSYYNDETKDYGTYAQDTNTHALHEDYELVQYGDFVFNTKNSTLPIITDTYYDTLFDNDTGNDGNENDNPDPEPEENNENTDAEKPREKGVKFKVSDIRSNIRKGVSYNVVNQVQLGLIRSDSYYNMPDRYSWSDSNGQMHDDYYYYVNGSQRSSSDGEMSPHGWLGYSYIDHNGQSKMYKKGNVYYVGGEFLTQSNTVMVNGQPFTGDCADYDLEGHLYTTRNARERSYGGYDTYNGAKNIRGAAMRNTEYKWGELVFVSKPDKVEDLDFDKTKQTLTWTKPVDEGYGVTGKNKTAQDDYIKINEYVVRVSDENGKELYNTTVERTAKNNVSFDLKNLVTKSGVYNISVTAKNPIGESEAVVYENAVVDLADIEVTMTPDQPVHISTDTVEFKETITNTGKLKLTNLIIYQTAMGEYVPMDGLTVKGTKASVAELDVGQSIDILYRVPASNAKNGVLTNTVEVTTNDQKLTDTASATVIVNEYNPLMTVTAVSDKKIYTDDDTVVITTTVENKGTEVFNNVTVNNSIEGGTYTNTDSEAVTASEERGSIIIKTLNPGDKIDLTYEIPAKDIKAGKNGAVQSIVKADDGTVTAGAMAEFRVIRPDVTIKAIPTKTEYKNDEDVTYTLLLKNTGNITLTDVTVSAGVRGTFDEIEQGEINSKGDMVIKELAAGKSVSLTYTVSSDNTTFGTMNNLFSVTANENASAEADTEIRIAFYGIDVMKTVEEKTYVVGDKVAFHTKVTNTGDGELKNIYITEDTAGTFKLADGAVIYTDDTIVIESLKAGESYTYDYYVDATEDNITDGMVGGTSSVRVNDELIGSDTSSTRVYTQSLTFKKTVDSDKEYRRGDKVVWTDTVTNTGECDLTNIVITESLVGEFKTDYETTADSVTIPKLAQGESVSVEFTSTITAADVTDRTYTCTAEVVAREYLSASDSASVKIVGPAVTVGKYADKNYYAKGERVVFTEVITNSGDLTLTNVKVVENFDGKYTQYDKSFTVDGRTLTIPEIAVGDSVVFHFAVDRSLIDSDTIESTITVTCDQDVSNSATVVVKVDNSSDPDTASDTNTDTDTNTSNTDSGKDNTDTSNDNTDTTNTDSGKDNTDKSNTDSSKDNTDTSNTDSGKDNTDTTNTDSGKDNTDTSNTDSGKDNTDTSNTDSGKDNTDTSNTDSGKDNTDSSNTDSGKDNTDSSNTDSGKDNTDTSIQPDTDTTGKESDDKPTKKHLMGDVNMDGKVTGKDAMIIQRYAINMVKLDPVQLFLADVTNDKKVTASDALNIMRYTIKMHTSSRTGEQVDIPSELLPKEQ